MASRIVKTILARFVFSFLGCEVGPGLRVDGPFYFRCPRRGAIRIGKDFQVRGRHRSNPSGLTNPSTLICFEEGRITIGDGSGMSAAVLSARSHMRIGNHVKIGANVRIFDHDFHAPEAAARRDSARDREGVESSPITVGDDVFIGANAIILKGVTLGDRCVVGAGAVVPHGVYPPDSVLVGNPARLLAGKKGTSEETGGGHV